MIDPNTSCLLPSRPRNWRLAVPRSTIGHARSPTRDLMLMRRIDELHLNYPFAGSRMLRDMLSQQGFEVGRRHVRTLMRQMAIEAIYRRPKHIKTRARTQDLPLPAAWPCHHAAQSSVGHGHHLHSHGAAGFVYLAAVVDWFSAACWPGSYRSPWM